MKSLVSMHLLRSIHTAFICVLFLFGTLVCTAEAADFIPEGTCCPSSQNEVPSSPAPEAICCQLGQVRFISSEKKVELTEEVVTSTFKKCSSHVGYFVTPIKSVLAKPLPGYLRTSHPFHTDHLRNTLNPRAPCHV